MLTRLSIVVLFYVGHPAPFWPLQISLCRTRQQGKLQNPPAWWSKIIYYLWTKFNKHCHINELWFVLFVPWQRKKLTAITITGWKIKSLWSCNQLYIDENTEGQIKIIHQSLTCFTYNICRFIIFQIYFGISPEMLQFLKTLNTKKMNKIKLRMKLTYTHYKYWTL